MDTLLQEVRLAERQVEALKLGEAVSEEESVGEELCLGERVVEGDTVPLRLGDRVVQELGERLGVTELLVLKQCVGVRERDVLWDCDPHVVAVRLAVLQAVLLLLSEGV